MPTHVIIGSSKGIGYAFLENLSQDPSNTIIGLVRSVETVQKKVEADGLKNVTILHADMEDYKTLKAAADKTATITGGAVDYLWINAAYQGHAFNTSFFTEWEGKEPEMEKEIQTFWETNVNGAYRSMNAFLPLVKKSSIKKVVAISSGHADTNLVTKYGVWEDAPYAMSKVALNMLIAKYDARFRSEGILFLSLSPGIVDVGKEGKFRTLPSLPLSKIRQNSTNNLASRRRPRTRHEIHELRPKHDRAHQARAVGELHAQNG